MKRYKRAMLYTAKVQEEQNLYKDENGLVWVKVDGTWERAVETFIYINPVWTLKRDPILKLVCEQDMLRAKLSGVSEEKIYEFVKLSMTKVERFHGGRIKRAYDRMTEEQFKEYISEKMEELNLLVSARSQSNDWIPNYENYLK